MYGKKEIEGRGWRDMRAFNWWDWHVGASYPLTDILLVIEDRLTMQQKADYLECYKYATTIMRAGDDSPFASSRLKGYTKTALLLEDGKWLARSHVDCDTLMGLSKDGPSNHEGDYVNWTHNMPHNISYGKGALERTLFVSSVLASTPMDFSGPKKYNQFMLAKYCFEPAIYKSQGFMMFAGRSTFASEMAMGCSIFACMLPMIGVYGEDEDNYLKRMIKRNLSTPDAINRVKRECSIYELKKLNDILTDESISGENDYEYAHAWYTGDRAAQQRNNYAVGIAMSSKREISYESINGCNKTGWHLGDGAVYLYTDYDRHQYDGSNFIAKNINVAYRIPGTTEDSRQRVIRSIASGWKSSKSFAGSMQIEDKYILAAMDFEAYHFEGEDTRPDDSGYGGSLPPHENDLVAKKAWFCFDDEIVCLGAGITSTMDSAVQTTVEHRRIVTDKLGIYIDGVGRLPEENCEKLCTGAKWALMDGHCGYAFPCGGSLRVQRYVSESAGEQSFILLMLDHGKDPTDADYCYVMYPYADREKMLECTAAPDFKILSNTKACQAVSEEQTGLCCYVFYEPGECGALKVDKPCLVTVSKDKLMVCDPTQELDSVRLTLNGREFVACVSGKRGARIDFDI
jgi:hyaluronate lyase